MLKLRELINDLIAIEKQMRRFEIKYSVLSSEFYQAFTSGELSEFDAYDEYRIEFIEWAALYQTWQKLAQEYQQSSTQQPPATRIRLQLQMA